MRKLCAPDRVRSLNAAVIRRSTCLTLGEHAARPPWEGLDEQFQRAVMVMAVATWLGPGALRATTR